MAVNTTLSPDANDMTLTVNSESLLGYTIQIAVENKVGQGPFSNPLQVEFDPIIQIAATNGDIQESFNSQERSKQVWIIGVASAALFILILLSAIICYKKKLNSRQNDVWASAFGSVYPFDLMSVTEHKMGRKIMDLRRELKKARREIPRKKHF